MDSEQKDVIITYETLYEMLRLEKVRPELQKFDKNFLQDCANYIKEKNELLEKSIKNPSQFSGTEGKNIELQLLNVKKILRELYDRREKKIIQMAMDKSRLPTALIDTSSLLKEEEDFFENSTQILTNSRKMILNAAINGIPQQEKPKVEVQKKETMMVRFLQAVPKFVGKELEIYGPFQEDDIANLPSEISNVLIQKGRAEEIKGD
ncbi:hypothetical protein ACFLZX_01505 [Nanoarchaeota archaeon]